MRKAQYIKPDRPLLVTVSELQGYVGLGFKSARKIAIAGYGKPDGTWLTGVFLTAIEHTGSSPVGAIK